MVNPKRPRLSFAENFGILSFFAREARPGRIHVLSVPVGGYKMRALTLEASAHTPPGVKVRGRRGLCFRSRKGEAMKEGRRGDLHDGESNALPILPPQFSSAGAGPEEFVLEHHRQPAFELPPLSSVVYCISLTLGRPYKVEIQRGGRRRSYQLVPGDVSVFPYGFSIGGATFEPCEFLALCIRPHVIESAAAGVPGDGRPEIKTSIGVSDPLAAGMLHDLLRELKAGGGVASPHVEALVEALSVHLVRHYSSRPRAAGGQADGMPDYVLSGAVAFIEDSLERDLSPAEIARAAGLSPARFARAFKAATGKPVREYVDERRVEKAKPLLASGELTPEEVARRVGFKSPRRFAAVFRKLTGVSPRSYRSGTHP